MWGSFTYKGGYGDAWEPELINSVNDITEPAHVGTWFINAAYAHPIWSQYVMYCISLIDIPGLPPAKKHSPHVTHEFWLYALNPKHKEMVSRYRDLSAGIRYLEPANYGYQMICESDEKAKEFVQNLVELICDGKLSPDTDYRSKWDAKLKDCISFFKDNSGELLKMLEKQGFKPLVPGTGIMYKPREDDEKK